MTAATAATRIPDQLRVSANHAMTRYGAGDDGAFAEVYALLAPRLLAFATRRTQNQWNAEDVVQQVFVRMHLARARFEPGADVVTWAFAITRNVLIDRFRAGQRQLPLVDDEKCQATCTHDDPERVVQRRQLSAHMQRQLSHIPDAQRKAFELVQYEGLTIAEAARTSATTSDAIKTRASRAYSALRATYDAVA